MKKRLLLVMLTLSALLHKAQAQGAIENYVYLGNNQALTVMPIAWYQTKSNWYFEGRYNYEALKTFSVYAGKTFEKKGTVSLGITPMLGLVKGEFNGGSFGLNVEVDYKKFSFSTQSQYTVSSDDRAENFFYSWADLSFKASNWLSTGLSFQHTKLYQEPAVLEKGVFIKPSYKNWSLPFYVFNPESSERYFIIGLSFGWDATTPSGKTRKQHKAAKSF